MNKQNTILIVDDVEINRGILGEIFAGEYQILEAVNGADALEKLYKNIDRIAVILLDIIMPVMDGFEVLKVLNEKNILNRIPVILVTGDTSEKMEKKGYDIGVIDIIKKPFDPHIVMRRVKNAAELYLHKNKLESLVREQTGKLLEQNEKLYQQARKLRSMNDAVIDAMSNIVEFRNLESGMHVKRIKKFTCCLATCIEKNYPEYGLNEDKISKITQVSAMHDIGKIAIPDQILLKPGRLTAEEFEIMKTHTVKGSELIQSIGMFQDEETYKYSYDICRHHHERFDGRGYPDGLSGEDIPIAAQIVSIADVYDALVTERVYKKPYDKETAYHMMMNGECGIFSPKLLKCLEKVRCEFEKLADEEGNS